MVVRLPGAVAVIFRDWLEREEPNRVTKVLGRIRSTRSGRFNDPRFGHRMAGHGPHADQLQTMFRVVARRHGLDREPPPLSAAHFTPPGGAQRGVFDEDDQG
jgi:DNA repair photolyase